MAFVCRKAFRFGPEGGGNNDYEYVYTCVRKRIVTKSEGSFEVPGGPVCVLSSIVDGWFATERE